MSGFPTRAHPAPAPADVLASFRGEEKAPRRAAEREDPRLPFAVGAGPEEESGRPQLEAAELAELDLEAPLPAPYARRAEFAVQSAHRR